jgi:hypothetical protein
VDDSVSRVALDAILTRFTTTRAASVVLERPTASILKFTAIPTITSDGQPLSSEHAATCIKRHPQWKDAEILEPPRFIFPKRNPDPLSATLQVKVKDTAKASVAKKLLETTVTFVGIARRCQEWTVSSTARQCSTCFKWGHTAFTCKARSPTCDQCGGRHLSSHHSQHVSQCRAPDCAHYEIRCTNCNDQHYASSVECPFFKARSSTRQLRILQSERVARYRRSG